MSMRVYIRQTHTRTHARTLCVRTLAAGAMAVRRVKTEDLRRVARATGGTS